VKIDVKTLNAEAAGSIELDDAIFGISEIRQDILQRMVKYQLAKRRAGTHKALTRTEVNRSRKKIYKQKGTGGARHGAANAPIFRGGGMAHAIHPRDYTHSLPKKVRALALKHALSAKAGDRTLIVLDDAVLAAPKTAELRKALTKLGLENALIIAGKEVDKNFQLAARNIPNVDVLPSAGLNVYDVLRRRHLVLTKDAVAAIGARFAPKVEGEAA
jgi:large subunit ribosomal protein L4